MIRIITIEREYGSGAAAIAQKLADRLGWKLWDRDITCDIARRLKCKVEAVEKREERPDPAFYRLVKVFMRGSYEESLSAGNVELLDAEHLAKLFEKVVQDAAAKGNCVIVGRGAPYFLRGRDDVFSVFMYAPYDEKIRRIMAQDKSREEAEELIERVDRERAAFVKKYFDRIWPQRDLYHLMINTKSGDEAVIDVILHKIELLDRVPASSNVAG
ncbi:MAG TPA: cytidylate kinase-like family protein [Bryobacteraceae bacterium]|nr:cytidylate kinase-like family protein [Bryobacteraceae bacterium]